MGGFIEAIYLSPVATELPRRVERALAIAGRGLEGDRYYHGIGTYSDHPIPTGRHLTLIEAEALVRAGIDGAAARRNIVIGGLQLGDLVGKRFRVGEVECFGQRLCEPCDYLEGLTRPGVMRALVHTGLRADILTGGSIAIGDPVHEEVDTPTGVAP